MIKKTKYHVLTLKDRFLPARLLEILIVASVYYAFARIGQTLAIPPGNVTPVWIPSGVLLAVALFRGYSIWPGIFLGAFIGNVWAYIDPASLSNIIRCIFTGTANGIGDVLCIGGGAYLIEKTTGTKNPFNSSVNTLRFIAFGAVAGPAVSAVLGVTALCLAGFMPWDLYAGTMLTWWTGDSVGALVIAPAIIVWVAPRKKQFLADKKLELFAFSVVLIAVTGLCLELLPVAGTINIPLFSIAPVLIWSVFRFGKGITFSGVLLVSAVSIVSTALGYGPFTGKQLNVSLLELQWFISVMSITVFILSSLIIERSKAQAELKKTNDNLEEVVKKRTRELENVNRGLRDEIRERSRSEKAHQESEELFKAVFEQAGGYCMILKPTDSGIPTILDVNRAACETHGYPREEMIGRPVTDLDDEEGKRQCLENTQYILSGKTLAVENIHVRKNGSAFPVAVYANVVHFENKPPLILSTEFDISERRKAEAEKQSLERQLQQAQKMESIGNLAGGIAHDFNNILSSIIGFTELALDDVEKESTIEDNLQEVYSAGKRAKDLVKQILAFARQSDTKLKPVQVDEILAEVLQFIRSSIPAIIGIKKDIASDSIIMGSQTQIYQVMMNLCTNAAHAMEDEGGILSVTLKDSMVDQGFDNEKLGLKYGDYIRISVSDTGTGIAPDIIGSIFEPYFTTKESGDGTGMGLAMVHGIIESYGGKILVDSQLGEGTTFTIYLPIIKNLSDHDAYVPEMLPTGTERILFVDDELPISKMVSQVLERLGYKVIIRTSSVEALKYFKVKPDDFDLVITDMTMPNLTGDKLAVEIMKVRPDIPVILCTGYSRKISEETIAEIGIRSLAYKPVITADLAKTVRKVLDENKA